MPKPLTKKQQHWSQILESAELSGLSLAEFARQNELPAKDLYRWRNQLKQKIQPAEISIGVIDMMRPSATVPQVFLCTICVDFRESIAGLIHLPKRYMGLPIGVKIIGLTHCRADHNLLIPKLY